jgi:hypothetical protein
MQVLPLRHSGTEPRSSDQYTAKYIITNKREITAIILQKLCLINRWWYG